MSKILAKAGDSLADVYDVQGSIAGIDNLLSKDVNLVHEMGGTIFSERLSSRIIGISTGDLSQSTAFSINFTASETSRLLGLSVVASNAGRLTSAYVALTSPPAVDNTDLPLFAWIGATDGSRQQDVLIAGVVSNLAVLISAIPSAVPELLIGSDSPRPAATITLRGSTNAFGAGTVSITVLVHLAFAQVQGLSSRGLPIPGW